MGRKIGELLGLEWLSERLPSQITGRPRLQVEVRDGLTYISDGVDLIVTTAVKRRRFYKHGVSARLRRLVAAYQIPDDLISSGDTVVNFGANVGEMSLAMSRRGASVVAIEPDPLTLRCLRLNTSEADVSIVPTGAWHSDEMVTFYQAPENADTSAINVSDAPVQIEARRLDTILADTPGRIRLLVGDAEGAEPEVLQGATDTLARTDVVAISAGYERNGESTVGAVWTILEAAGFVIRGVSKHGYLLASRLPG